MLKCSPTEMRKNLQVVELFKKTGVDFVPIPVLSLEHKIELVKQCQTGLQMAYNEAKNETNS